jgi:hypothetical protein
MTKPRRVIGKRLARLQRCAYGQGCTESLNPGY